MKPHQNGIAAILDIASSELDHQLTTEQEQNKDELLNIIQNYLNLEATYEQSCEAFIALGMQTDTLDKIHEIKTVEEAPLPSIENQDENSHKKSRPWSPIEDNRLLAGILRYGLDNWSTVAMFVGNDRTRAQCSQRWSRGLNPRISKDTWSTEEESLLLRLIQQFGDKSWTKIASLLGNRSDVQCRYHYHQINKNSQTLQFGSAPSQPISNIGILNIFLLK
ncbi:Myb-like DNA-binding domain containing protein [Tritrichomonas foetus]|uniref:Myb-like DNA-binding domain containing protein n=1 Tax=Tritrichomonas foetus TaxID=1144522 RepID=A0A1J4J5Q0_9EUKA|nr:Myb-like DNA-binding domain containing protein [Tritrichomonas foetus]|eukprot:OHS92979.1 Myb-like DNA-binding domain containing protein [Tritrichomonas foetus]